MSDTFKITDKILSKSFLKLLPSWITPNHITIFRFLTIPFVLWLLVGEQYAWGVALFIISAFTDVLDGALARMANQVTDWGKMFDPLADKLLVGTVAVVVVSEFINIYLALIIIVIELFLILGAYYRKRYRNFTVQAETSGKIKMFLQTSGISLLLIYAIHPVVILLTLAIYVLYASVIAAFISLVVYRGI